MKKMFSIESGFTLVEMLVVIAIIAILASIFLVGLGGFRSSAYDTRRISDLQHVQSYLELYYNSHHQYPQDADYTTMGTTLSGAGIGVTGIPNDPAGGNATYYYTYCGTQSYVLGALISPSASVLKDMPSSLKTGGGNCNKTFVPECGANTGGNPDQSMYCVGT